MDARARVLLVQCLVPGCFPDSRIVSLPPIVSPQLSFLFSAPRLQRTLLFSSSSDRVAQMLSRRPGGRRVVSDAAAHPVQHLPLALGHKVLGGDGAPTANPRTLSLACHRCTARSGQRVLACRTWARCFRLRHLQWVGAPAVRVVMRRVEYSTGAPLFCAKHVSRAVSEITGRCSAASHTGLCPCTQRPVRHRDPARVDACIVPPPPSLPECRAAAPLAPCAHPRANSYSRRNGDAAAGHGHAHVCIWDLHGRVVRRRAARTRHNGQHQRRQVRAARGRVCGRLRRHAAEAAWTREAAAGGSGRERGAWRVSGRRACPAVGSLAACAGPGLTG